jgi:hypothetical protein
MILQGFDVGIDHELDEFFELGFRLPTEFLFGFAVIADEQIDFGRPHVTGVEFDVVPAGE